MTAKAVTKTARTAFCGPVNVTVPVSSSAEAWKSLVGGLHLVDQRPAGIRLDSRRVAHYEPDAYGRADDEDHQTPDEPFVERRAGEARGNARGKRVDGGAQTPMPQPSKSIEAPTIAS